MRNLKCVIISWMFLAGCVSSKDQDIILDINGVLNKRPAEIKEILGDPDTSYNKMLFGQQYLIHRYNKLNDAEIRYREGLSEEVLINSSSGLEFKPETLTRFGFPKKEPTTFDTSAFYTWKNLGSVKVANMYLVGTKKPDSVRHNFKLYFKLR